MKTRRRGKFDSSCRKEKERQWVTRNNSNCLTGRTVIRTEFDV